MHVGVWKPNNLTTCCREPCPYLLKSYRVGTEALKTGLKFSGQEAISVAGEGFRELVFNKDVLQFFCLLGSRLSPGCKEMFTANFLPIYPLNHTPPAPLLPPSPVDPEWFFYGSYSNLGQLNLTTLMYLFAKIMQIFVLETDPDFLVQIRTLPRKIRPNPDPDPQHCSPP